MTTENHEITTVTDVDEFERPQPRSEFSFLVTIYGENLGRRFVIASKPLLIGRSSDCDIQLADDCLSRMHCRIISASGGIIVNDLDSTNGTYVNGTAVAARPLKDGDRLKVGRTIFKFLTGDNIEHAYHEEIYRLKTTDGLTGAFNKRYFMQEGERELYRFHRYKRPLSLLMMDIDFFKQINDKYGHLAGDRVLAQLAALISANVRREDTFCRYGGEEFALLMPEMPIETAAATAERLRKLAQEAHYDFEGLKLAITISIGVGAAHEETQSLEEFIRLADDRLYAAKHQGRNRIVSE